MELMVYADGDLDGVTLVCDSGYGSGMCVWNR
jgi:hypothetical protein